MKLKTINYSKVFSLGNYENEKLGVEFELQENEDPNEAFQKARQFVEFNHKLNGIQDQVSQAQYVVDNPDEFTGNQVKQAKAKLEQLEKEYNTGMKLLH